MNKRYRLYVNGEWLASSDDLSFLNDWASKIWQGDNYYGYFPDVVIYDTVEREEV